ncbi:MAG: hypothetical protein WC130_03600 [Kiritimatiellia bacterium]
MKLQWLENQGPVMAMNEDPAGGGGADPGAGAAPAGGAPAGDPAAAPAGGTPAPAGGGGADPGAGAGAAPAGSDPKPGTSGADAGKPAGDPAAAGDDWRRKLAGEDEGDLKTLGRFASEKDLWNAYKNLRGKVSSGELKAPLAKDATPEQIKEYREANGIPDAAEKYLEAIPDGVDFGDEDRAAMVPFLKEMHDMNAPKEYVQAAMKAYHNSVLQQNERIRENDSVMKSETEESLRAEWGPDYKPNMAAVNNLMDAHFPADVKAALMNARDHEMKPLLFNKGFLQAMAQLGRELNPVGSTYGTGMDNIDTIDSEMKKIEGKMGTKEYWKDEKMQGRYRELVAAKQRFSGKK